MTTKHTEELNAAEYEDGVNSERLQRVPEPKEAALYHGILRVIQNSAGWNSETQAKIICGYLNTRPTPSAPMGGEESPPRENGHAQSCHCDECCGLDEAEWANLPTNPPVSTRPPEGGKILADKIWAFVCFESVMHHARNSKSWRAEIKQYLHAALATHGEKGGALALASGEV